MRDYNYDEIRAFLNAHPEDEIKVVGRKMGIPIKVVWRVFQLDTRKNDPEYSPNSKTSQILKYLQAHPHCSNARISKTLGCSSALVVDTRRLWKDLTEDPITAPHYAPVKPVKSVKPANRKIWSAPMYGVPQLELESNPIYRNLAVSEDDNEVRPRVVGPHKMLRVTKAEAEALKVEAYAQTTRGRPDDFNTVEQVLAERGEDYGDYASKAQFIQGVKYLMRSSPSWEAMDADMRESMEMIAHKMGRTLYGNPTHKDNFLDIAGYAKLVADRL
jgi:hypothetical protein